MVLRYLFFVVVWLGCMLKVTALYAYHSPNLQQEAYWEPLTRDSMEYAWELYQQSLDCLEKKCPSFFEELSEEAEKIFGRELDKNDFSWKNLELVRRNLEINFSRNKTLIDKDEDSSLGIAYMSNLLKVSTNLVRVKTILEQHDGQPDSIYSFYEAWFQRCKVRYLADCSLYKIKQGKLQEALTSCEEALTLSLQYEPVSFHRLSKHKDAIQYLMQLHPDEAGKMVEGLKQIASPVFTKEEIFQNGTLPLFYLYTIQMACICERQGYLEQAAGVYRCLLAEIRKYLSADLSYFLPEERDELGNLLRYYLDMIQRFSLRHVRHESVAELLLEHSLLKENLLAVSPSPVTRIKEDSRPIALDLQKSIDSLYYTPDYYLLPGNPRYFSKFEMWVKLIGLKRRQVSLLGRFSPSESNPAQLKDWKSLKKWLAPDETLIKIIDLPINFYDRQYVALVMRADLPCPRVVVLPKKRELFRLRVENREADEIWKPINRFIGSPTKLFLCLEGDMMEVYWGNILYRKKRLLETYDLHYLLSIKDFLRLKMEKEDCEEAEYTLYGFGGAYFSQLPSLKGVRGQGVQYLPGSREELCRIDMMLSGRWKSHLFLGREANKANFLSLSFRVAPHSIIHVATHGFSLLYDKTIPDGRIVSFEENPLVGCSAYKNPMLRNGFLLTGANRYWNKPIPYDAMDSGIVTACDVSQMNLNGTDLVVLSACRSASGEMKDGEGLFGLIRAFKVAGAKAVLANLNDISDIKTVLFTTTFYRYWVNGCSMFDAFVKTQRELINSHPENVFLWSGFVLFE